MKGEGKDGRVSLNLRESCEEKDNPCGNSIARSVNDFLNCNDIDIE